MNPDEESTAK